MNVLRKWSNKRHPNTGDAARSETLLSPEYG